MKSIFDKIFTHKEQASVSQETKNQELVRSLQNALTVENGRVLNLSNLQLDATDFNYIKKWLAENSEIVKHCHTLSLAGTSLEAIIDNEACVHSLWISSYWLSINLSGSCRQPNITQKILASLKENVSFKKLFFDSNILDDSTITDLAYLLENSKMLEVLSLKECHLTDQLFVKLFPVLKGQEKYIHLDLRNNPLTNNSLALLNELSTHNPYILQVDINEENLSEELLSAFKKQLLVNQAKYIFSKLELDLSNQQIIKEVYDIISNTANTGVLEIKKTAIKDLDVLSVSDYLKYHSIIKRHIHALRIERLDAAAADKNNPLVFEILLQQIPALDELHINHTHLASRETNQILKSCLKYPNLKKLSFDGNQLDSQCVLTLIELLKQSEHLTYLSLRNCQMTDDLASQLMTEISKHPRLRSIDLSLNTLTKAVFPAFELAALNNPQLISIKYDTERCAGIYKEKIIQPSRLEVNRVQVISNELIANLLQENCKRAVVNALKSEMANPSMDGTRWLELVHQVTHSNAKFKAHDSKYDQKIMALRVEAKMEQCKLLFIETVARENLNILRINTVSKIELDQINEKFEMSLLQKKLEIFELYQKFLLENFPTLKTYELENKLDQFRKILEITEKEIRLQISETDEQNFSQQKEELNKKLIIVTSYENEVSKNFKGQEIDLMTAQKEESRLIEIEKNRAFEELISFVQADKSGAFLSDITVIETVVNMAFNPMDATIDGQNYAEVVHAAFDLSHRQALEVILKRGGDVLIRNKEGKTVLEKALQKSDKHETEREDMVVESLISKTIADVREPRDDNDLIKQSLLQSIKDVIDAYFRILVANSRDPGIIKLITLHILHLEERKKTIVQLYKLLFDTAREAESDTDFEEALQLFIAIGQEMKRGPLNRSSLATHLTKVTQSAILEIKAVINEKSEREKNFGREQEILQLRATILKKEIELQAAHEQRLTLEKKVYAAEEKAKFALEKVRESYADAPEIAKKDRPLEITDDATESASSKESTFFDVPLDDENCKQLAFR